MRATTSMRLRASMAIALLALGASWACAEDLIALSTCSGVTQSFLLAAPAEPRAVALLFPGGDGKADLNALQGRFDMQRGNFLIRARKHLLEVHVVTAVLNVPSDRSEGVDDDFRFSAAHATDVRAVVAELKRKYPGLPVFLVGTSRGTVSAAATGSALGADVAGVVLTATVTQPTKGRWSMPGLSGFDYARVKTRLLFVHHRDDACYVSPYYGVRSLGARYPLIAVSGGDPARAEPCQALTPHGFIGHEARTMAAIADWMLGRPHPERIE